MEKDASPLPYSCQNRAIVLPFSPSGMHTRPTSLSLAHSARFQQDQKVDGKKHSPSFPPFFISSAVREEPHMPEGNPARGCLLGWLSLEVGVAHGSFSSCLEPAQTPDHIFHMIDAVPLTPWRCPERSWLLTTSFLHLQGASSRSPQNSSFEKNSNICRDFHRIMEWL